MSNPASGERPPLWVIVMGVAGCGKTTLGSALSAALCWDFIDGDTLHPLDNIRKMSQGIPLTDADRAPWLEALAALIQDSVALGIPGVLACSALKAAYRGKLSVSAGIRIVYLKGNRALFASRLSARQGHFMPPELLESQFADLEEPADALTLDAALPVADLVAEIQRYYCI